MSGLRELNEAERGMIIGAHRFGHSIRAFSDKFQIPRSTVGDVVLKWERERVIKPQSRPGNPKIMSDRDRRSLRRVVKANRQMSLGTVATNFRAASGSVASARTIRRELIAQGFHGRAAAHKPNISPSNARHRFQWCRARCQWTEEQ
ncbi:uncharacterized protein [Parasteatoda tepidariorum]|uniref:uncharacterized protein n=1 Tax=Parasteatoda tepidariorum TaxID=114398 RepID=UPI0039BD8A34